MKMRLADYGSLVCVAHDWQAAYDSRQALLADKTHLDALHIKFS